MKDTLRKHRLVYLCTAFALTGCSSIPFFGDEAEDARDLPQAQQQPAQAELDKQEMQTKFDDLSSQLAQLQPTITQLSAGQNELKQTVVQLNSMIAKQTEIIKNLKSTRGVATPQAQGSTPGYALQLFSLSNRQEIQPNWNALVNKHPQILSSLQLKYEQVTVNNKVYFRVKAGKFNSRAAAIAACDKLRTAGSPCLPASFNGTRL